MRIVICARQVFTVDDDVELNEAATDVDGDFRDAGISEWDQAAVEAALRLRDDGLEVEIVLVAAADEEADPILRRLLAMGADRARRIEVAADLTGDPVATAHVLAHAVRDEAPDLVLTGALAADQGNGATGSALAGLLDWPALAVVKKLAISDGTCRAERELEGGAIAATTVRLPAVVSVQTGHYQPRYANLRAIKQAEAKELAVEAADPPERRQRLRRMFVPVSDNEVALLGDDPANVAARIFEIVEAARR